MTRPLAACRSWLAAVAAAPGRGCGLLSIGSAARARPGSSRRTLVRGGQGCGAPSILARILICAFASLSASSRVRACLLVCVCTRAC
eukprot:13538879-Alexandrium_andersonii.AAC.1